MRKKATFNVKNCELCGESYTPVGPVSKYCNHCRIIADKERKQNWYKNNNPDAYSVVPKKHTHVCAVCGLPFISSYKGIDCCQKHYNIAYRTGSPYTPEGRKSTNTFIEKEVYMVGITKNGIEYLFDKNDFPLVSCYSWCLSKTGYLVANIKNKVTKLHRYIISAEPNKVIDHINGNPLDNRKSNLRVTDHKGNSRNTSVSKVNKLKQLGISTTSDGKKYRARIMVDGKEINLGRFSNLREAIQVRKKAEIKYFGEYSPSLSRDE